MKERLKKFVAYTKMGETAFEDKVGLSRGFVSKDRDSIREASLSKILLCYPELNPNWLKTGEGSMLNTDDKDISDAPKISYTKGVPYYNVDFIGGFDMVLNDQTTNPEYLIDFQKYNDATCWCNVTGHSMEPEINHGDIIALKKIEDWSFLPLGEIYAIVTKNEMRTIKRFGRSNNPDAYNLVPSNKSSEYGEQDLPKDMIQAIFLVLGCMKRF